MVGRLRERLEKGKDAERRLVECILSDPQFAAHAPIAEIAERAAVSEPTITRLARALGFSGTRDMRFHLAQALAIGGAYLREPPPSPDEGSLTNNPIAAVATGAHDALDLMTFGLVESDIKAIARRVADAPQILVCGTGGGSSMAAVELQNRLFRLGLKVTAQTDPQLQRMNASVLVDPDVIIGFSISGQARSVLDALLIARQYGAHAVAVTAPDTPLAASTDTMLPLTFREDGNLYKPSSVRYALLAAVDILSMATAHAVGPGAIEHLRRVRQSLASQDIRNPKLPIGD
ncbi:MULTISPECIES: MurR/RpiR family transcriptional regulator [unclassified Roseitalea]|uniref:MurR/RpiR family transcriptional regulator n=1 Tax=unclassified Roseitalea TaxID=2639107 RepID=UPI0027400B7B|nr:MULTISPECIES: MurR/RpiR family transcriptional regulator [unclassified Roseitalea]